MPSFLNHCLTFMDMFLPFLCFAKIGAFHCLQTGKINSCPSTLFLRASRNTGFKSGKIGHILFSISTTLSPLVFPFRPWITKRPFSKSISSNFNIMISDGIFKPAKPRYCNKHFRLIIRTIFKKVLSDFLGNINFSARI